MKEQTFHIQFHQYLQWTPTKEEYTEILRDPESAGVFKPHFIPSNAVSVESEVEESRGGMHALHVLLPGMLDVWGEEAKMKENEILFGLSRKYEVTVSSPLELSRFPFDVQSLHIFFESMSTTDILILMPCTTRGEVLDLELGAMASDPDYKMHQPVVEFNAFASVEEEGAK